MHIELPRQKLVQILGRCQSIVEKRTTQPALINVFMSAEGETLNALCTNLEVSLFDETKCIVHRPGQLAVNAKSLFDVTNELRDGVVEITKRDNHWAFVKQGAAEFNIIGINPSEYPVFPSLTSDKFVEVDTVVLSEMIEKTIFSVAVDETRYHLNGVYLEKGEIDPEALRMVATDGHRLSFIERRIGPQPLYFEGDGVIIPRKALIEIKRLLPEVGENSFSLAIEGVLLLAKSGNTVISARLIEGKHPTYKVLIPKSLSETVEIERTELLDSLKRVALLSSQKSRGISLSFTEDRIEITSSSPELGDAKEELEINYKGKDVRIGFNAKYFLEALGSIYEDRVKIEFKDQLTPGLVKPTQDVYHTCVVMPMKL